MEKALVDLVGKTLQAYGRATVVLASMMGLGYGSMQVVTLRSTRSLRAHGLQAQLTPPSPKPPMAVAGVPGRHTSKNRLLRGIASWYGEVWDGRLTASGEVFRQTAMTACHPSLPFGTLVRVINLRNHRSVVVRINDRGLQGTGRVIDLSSAAAEQIGMLEAGLAPVRLEVVRWAAARG